MKLVVASRNGHKLRELARMLPGYRLEPIGAEVALPAEEGATFAENALVKARAAASATGDAAIGEDSGLEAEALGGAPGVRSARYAADGEENAPDEENTAKLLREAPVGSRLRYVCALAYVDPQRAFERIFEGRCEGTLAERPRGGGGFGYDPVFVSVDGPGELTMAELADAQKDAISHRGRAVAELRRWLESSKADATSG